MKNITTIPVLLVWVVRAQAGEIPPYDRRAWGGWPDGDGDCQDLRAELLVAQSRVPVTFREGGACVVATGEWIGAYRGDLFTDARDVEIDHVVPLKVAHDDSGGRAWTRARKRAFARGGWTCGPAFGRLIWRRGRGYGGVIFCHTKRRTLGI